MKQGVEEREKKCATSLSPFSNKIPKHMRKIMLRKTATTGNKFTLDEMEIIGEIITHRSSLK